MFTELFTTGKLGLGITKAGVGKRDKRAHSEFRAELIEAYKSQNPDHQKDFLWCPVIKDWAAQVDATAAHIFAYIHGQECMDAIFGPSDPPELFSPLNGMILSTLVEAQFDKGFMVIVPRLPDNPSPAQVSLWNNSNPKEYKIRIIDFDHPTIDDVIRPESSDTWKDLDNTNLEFRSDVRPRASYLYFHYCVQLLRRSWRESPEGKTLKKHLGERYWGAPGAYLPKSQLLALVEEMGHEYKQLLEGAAEDSPEAAEEDREILLAVAADQIKASSQSALGEEDDDDDKDDDDDEDEDDEEDDDEEDEEADEDK